MLIRNNGKLPDEKQKITYDLEYGQDTLEIHDNAVSAGQPVLIVDDLLATGGTVSALCQLKEKLGGVVAGVAVLVELSDLGGRKLLGDKNVSALVHY